MLRLISIFFFCIILSVHSTSQSQEDFTIARLINHSINDKSIYSEFKNEIKNNNNELELLISSFFYVYKEFFSSQDANKCNFYPSCSLYGITSVKKHGFIKGGVMTMDRLTRCNGLSPEKYKINIELRKFEDPIK
jgi:hypothetical protein